MAGKIREKIDFVIKQRAAGNPMLEKIIKTKMILKGINPSVYTEESEDDPAILQKLDGMAMELSYLCKEAATVDSNESTAAESTSKARKSRKLDILTAYSGKGHIDEAIREIEEQFVLFDPKLLLFFSSAKFAADEISQKMQTAFPHAEILGCTTAGEIVTGKMLDNSVVVMGFNNEAIPDVKVEVIQDIHDPNGLQQAFDAFSSHFGEPVTDMASREYVGLILADGLSGAEENLIEAIGDLTNVVFIGGSAGDDLQFSATHVFANGKAHSGAAVLALLKPGMDFTFVKTQSFRDLGKKLEVTKADESKREVLEFNGKPAAVAYAEAVNSTPEEASNHFMRNPVGLIIDDEPFVRSPQQIKEGGAMDFYCSVREGMELSLLESGDIIEETRKALQEAQNELGMIYGVINFNCILRTLDLKQQNLTDAYGDLFSPMASVGFSTYGEQYIGHINQTATMLVFR